MVGKTKMSLPGQVGWHIGKANFILQVPDKNCRNQFINSTIIRVPNVFTWPPESSPSIESPGNKETPAFTWAKTPTNLWGNFIKTLVLPQLALLVHLQNDWLPPESVVLKLKYAHIKASILVTKISFTVFQRAYLSEEFAHVKCDPIHR